MSRPSRKSTCAVGIKEHVVFMQGFPLDGSLEAGSPMPGLHAGIVQGKDSKVSQVRFMQ